MTRLAIKLDVDTLRGYMEGVPPLLALFKRRGLRASIFFSFGPDNSGRAIRRVFRPGFVSKMVRTRAPSTYGLRTLMYGTLLPAPLIVPSAPGIVSLASDEGHDIGIHAWDHVYVQDRLKKISKAEYLSLFGRARELFVTLCGREPASIAAPGWQVTRAVLEAEEELGLAYASDARGRAPFTPVYEDKRYRVPQIPTTLPTMDEVLGLPGIDDETLPKRWIEGMGGDWNVLTIHAEMEGISKIAVFERFLDLAESIGTEFMTLAEYAEKAPLPDKVLAEGRIRGRAGTLAVEL